MTHLDRVAVRIYRALWRLHPRSHRQRYLDEALVVAVRQAARARGRRAAGGVLYWLRACSEVIPAALRLRRTPTPRAPDPRVEGRASMFTTLVDDARQALRSTRAR